MFIEYHMFKGIHEFIQLLEHKFNIFSTLFHHLVNLEYELHFQKKTMEFSSLKLIMLLWFKIPWCSWIIHNIFICYLTLILISPYHMEFWSELIWYSYFADIFVLTIILDIHFPRWFFLLKWMSNNLLYSFIVSFLSSWNCSHTIVSFFF